MSPGVAIDERFAVYVPIIAVVTGIFMRVTPAGFDKRRFGPLVNFAVGIVVVVVVDLLWGAFAKMSVLKGLLVAASTSGLYDAGKSVGAIAKNKEDE